MSFTENLDKSLDPKVILCVQVNDIGPRPGQKQALARQGDRQLRLAHSRESEDLIDEPSLKSSAQNQLVQVRDPGPNEQGVASFQARGDLGSKLSKKTETEVLDRLHGQIAGLDQDMRVLEEKVADQEDIDGPEIPENVFRECWVNGRAESHDSCFISASS